VNRCALVVRRPIVALRNRPAAVARATSPAHQVKQLSPARSL
jgi:hypothetical protein